MSEEFPSVKVRPSIEARTLARDDLVWEGLLVNCWRNVVEGGIYGAREGPVGRAIFYPIESILLQIRNEAYDVHLVDVQCQMTMRLPIALLFLEQTGLSRSFQSEWNHYGDDNEGIYIKVVLPSGLEIPQ